MKFMGNGGMKAGIKTKENQGTFTFLSKAVENGNVYRIMFPVIKLSPGEEREDGTFVPSKEMGIDDEFDIQAVTLPGYKMDMDKMGTTFMPLNDYDVTDTGKVLDKGPMPSYSRISRILFDAEYKRECSKAEAEVKREAEELGNELNPVTLNESLRKLDEAYHGAKVNGKNIAPTEQQAINALRVCMFTAGVIFKLEGEVKPSIDCDIIGFSLELNGTKSTQLKTALTKAIAERREKLTAIQTKKMSGVPLTEEEMNYKHMLDVGYIEVEYAYKGTSKQEAGRAAAFNYCSEAADATCKKFPEFWAKRRDDIVGRLIYDMETMAAKNRNISMAPSPEKVRLSFLKYCTDQAVLGRYIEFEGEEGEAVKRAAADMLKIDGFRKNPSFWAKLEEAYAEGKSEDAVAIEADEEEDVTEQAVAGILKAQQENPHASMQQILESAGGEVGLNAASMQFSAEPGEL